MTSIDEANDFFTEKHKRLVRIAAIANVLAWVVFGVYLFYAVLTMLTVVRSNCSDTQAALPIYNIIPLIDEYRLCVIRVFSLVLTTFLHGVIYGLVLKAVSLGLNMIVETDLNYRKNAPEVSHE
jgi:hypothetical protein